MTNWHIPSQRRPTNPWTPEEWERAKQLMAEGAGYDKIAERLGRSRKAVKSKFQEMNRSPKQKEAKLEYQRRKRSEGKGVGREAAGIRDQHEMPCAEIFIERNRRLSLAPKSLTAAFFGDPLPGYSALDRRAAQ